MMPLQAYTCRSSSIKGICKMAIQANSLLSLHLSPLLFVSILPLNQTMGYEESRSISHAKQVADTFWCIMWLKDNKSQRKTCCSRYSEKKTIKQKARHNFVSINMARCTTKSNVFILRRLSNRRVAETII